jgi:hypothetical protein
MSLAAAAQVQPYAESFRTQEIKTNRTTRYLRVGGHRAAILLLHGYGETGDMCAPLAGPQRPLLGHGAEVGRTSAIATSADLLARVLQDYG